MSNIPSDEAFEAYELEIAKLEAYISLMEQQLDGLIKDSSQWMISKEVTERLKELRDDMAVKIGADPIW